MRVFWLVAVLVLAALTAGCTYKRGRGVVPCVPRISSLADIPILGGIATWKDPNKDGYRVGGR